MPIGGYTATLLGSALLVAVASSCEAQSKPPIKVAPVVKTICRLE